MGALEQALECWIERNVIPEDSTYASRNAWHDKALTERCHACKFKMHRWVEDSLFDRYDYRRRDRIWRHCKSVQHIAAQFKVSFIKLHLAVDSYNLMRDDWKPTPKKAVKKRHKFHTHELPVQLATAKKQVKVWARKVERAKRMARLWELRLAKCQADTRKAEYDSAVQSLGNSWAAMVPQLVEAKIHEARALRQRRRVGKVPQDDLRSSDITPSESVA